MATPSQSEMFTPLKQAAASVGVPIAWLKAEAEAGRIPHLRAGRHLLFNQRQVEEVLLNHAAKSFKPTERRRDA